MNDLIIMNKLFNNVNALQTDTYGDRAKEHPDMVGSHSSTAVLPCEETVVASKTGPSSVISHMFVI